MSTNRIIARSIFLLLIPILQAQDPAVEWVKTHAIPITTTEARHGFADMQPIKRIVGDARIVELGEATHGTREFFQLKHRMLEFLATQMGFTIFTIEANMPEAYRLNDYVLNGTGDPAQMLKGLYFWTWNTEEVLDMIRWMREFNQSGKGRVEFTGFDMQTTQVADAIVREFVAKNDPGFLISLSEASAQASKTASGGGSQAFGVATATFPVKYAAGKRVHYSGWIKTQDVTSGFAGLWWRVDGKSGVLAFDNMQDRGVTGSTDWKRCEIDLPVSADATNINFGALFPGSGTAWFSGLAIELDGKPYTDANALDLDFTGGFYLGGNGYSVQIDPDVMHGERHSLRMTRVSAPVEEKSLDPAIAAASWMAVMDRLENSRAAYLKKGAASHDIDWAVQNARVVQQCMLMRAGKVSRDASMAANIKWIADANPRAKVVVWAHNGHVATGKEGGSESMGQTLRTMFGKQMVVFGFAFNQGSFQAVEMGKSLHTFTVPPMAAGTLDATLASSGLPVFALDLRSAPAWFREPRKSRSIGAVYATAQANNFMIDMRAPEMFDAILFVENTTAARPNPPPAAQ